MVASTEITAFWDVASCSLNKTKDLLLTQADRINNKIINLIPLTLEVCIFQGLTSSAGQRVWNLPDGPHTPVYPES
jgi:hypothetical protein